MRQFAIIALFMLFIIANPIPTTAQTTDCGVVEQAIFPVDTNTFTLTQGFGVASPRHNGRFHTGADWYAGRDTTLGQPIRAVARGRVTIASPNGWGRDGGVIILEHRLNNGDIFYSMYGHVMQTNTAPFPTALSCVESGQIIGVIADVRPAPHLHFEIRLQNGSSPGPGYVTNDPILEGWVDPIEYLTNLQARLHPAFLWSTQLQPPTGSSDISPTVSPLALNDDSLIVVNGARDMVRRILPDGRILWRLITDVPIVAITPFVGQPLLTLADGTMRIMSLDDGRNLDLWNIEGEYEAGAMIVNDWLLLRTINDTLVAIDTDRRTILWELDDVIPYVRHQVAGSGLNLVIGGISRDLMFQQIASSGAIIGDAQLRQMGAFGQAVNGDLLVYGLGGLWQIDVTGTWQLVQSSPVPTEGKGAVHLSESGRIYLFDGNTFYAYSPDKMELWRVALGEVNGVSDITAYGTILVLTNTDGQLIALNDAGRLCNRTQIHGGSGYDVWHDLGDDGRLRVFLHDQIVTFDWERFTRNCN